LLVKPQCIDNLCSKGNDEIAAVPNLELDERIASWASGLARRRSAPGRLVAVIPRFIEPAEP